MTANSYLNNREFQPHDLEPGDLDSQYAPTPGYYGRTPASSCGFSPSPEYHAQNDLGVLSQQQSQTPRLLQQSEWHDGMSSIELPASCIQYTVDFGNGFPCGHKRIGSRPVSETTLICIRLKRKRLCPKNRTAVDFRTVSLRIILYITRNTYTLPLYA
jgi:hypothetical protein